MRIRVLVISFLFPNPAALGYGVFVLNRIRAIAAFCEIRVVAPIQRYLFVGRWVQPISGGAVPEQASIDGIEIHHPRFSVIPRYGKALDALTFLSAVRSVLRRFSECNPYEFDVIDVHWTYPDAFAGAALSKWFGKPFIVTVRGHEALYDTEVSIRRWLLELCLKRADAVVALSDELAKKLVLLGVAKERIHVILNGVDTDSFSLRNTQASRAKLGIPLDRQVLLSVGRLTEGKGHHILIDAVGSTEEAAEVQLYIVGGINPEDDFGPRLRAHVLTSGLRNIHFIESVAHSDLVDWYASADVFCLATKREGCPNVVLEALACGTPVIASRVGSVPRMIDPGFNGLLVDEPVVDQFRTTIREALAIKWDRAAIAERMQHWSWEGCAHKVLALYEKVGLGR